MKSSAFFYAVVALLFAASGIDRLAAQTSAAAFTSYTRYDAFRRVTGTILPDPDGSGALKYAATRNTYDDNGRLIKVETGQLSTWQAASVAPANWTGFTILTTLETTYDAVGRKLTDKLKGSDGVIVSVTQYSYDAVGRLECTAVRMNPSIYGSLPSSACALGTQGTNGPDRIARTIYDVAGQVQQLRKAVGTSIEIADVTYSYTPDGKIEYVIDAKGNRAKLEYDGFDRQAKWIFPSTTLPAAYNPSSQANALATAGGINAADYEEYGYDANGNRISLRKRDGITFAYTYDALNRMTIKTVPTRTLPGATSTLATTHTRDVYYSYDLAGNQLKAWFDSLSTGEGVTNVYDGFERLTSATLAMDSKSWALTYQYDADGNRTRITHPDGAYFQYSFDGLDRLNLIENASGQDLVVPAYNTRGLLASVGRLSSAKNQTYSYDVAGRLSGLSLAGGSQTSSDVAWTLTRGASSQVLTNTRDNDAYAYNGFANVTRSYTANGLNQYTQVSGTSHCADKNGNLIWDGTYVYVYDAENRLVQMREDRGSCPDANNDYTNDLVATLRYDPLGRLYELNYPAGSWTARFLYDGDALVAEYWSTGTPTGTGSLIRRFVHGSDAGADDPVLWFEGTTATGSSDAKNLYADRLGSIVLVGDSSGNATYKYGYDDWGAPAGTQASRFLYTGQAYFWELGLYHYKARMYSPALGRFMQTDPVGYEDQFNLYAYVGNDPVNGTDTTGQYRGLPFSCSDLGSACGTMESAFEFDQSIGVRTAADVAELHGKKSDQRDTQSPQNNQGTVLEQRNTRSPQKETSTPIFCPTAEACAVQQDLLAGRGDVADRQAERLKGQEEAGIVGVSLLPVGRLLGPVARTLGPTGRVFGSSRFGNGARRGALNSGRVRIGFTPHNGRAYFRIGIGNRHIDIFSVPRP